VTSRAKKFRQAAIVYVGVGVIVILLTLVAGASPTRSTPPLTGLAIGATFVVIFGALMYLYGWFERSWEGWDTWVSKWAIWHRWGTWHKVTLTYFFPYLYVIYYLVKRGGGPKVIIEVLTNLFVVTNWMRMLQYFINFLGYRLEINFRQFSIAIHPSEFAYPILFLICALLMACITYMLARAAWDL